MRHSCNYKQNYKFLSRFEVHFTHEVSFCPVEGPQKTTGSWVPSRGSPSASSRTLLANVRWASGAS